MNYQSKGLQFSIAIHMLLFLIVFNISSLVPAKKLMVIDFNLENSPGAEEVRDRKPEIGRQRPEIREQKQEIKNPEQKLVSGIIPDSHPSETQAPVQAPVEQKIDGNSHSANITSENKTVVAKTGSNENADPSRNLDGKTRYLKENFSYIRDAIQKRMNYPKIAQQMGWEGKVVVSFIVCADGYAKDVRIKEGSGVEMLDRNAIETVKKASPFPMPPAEAQLLIPIKYSLN